MNIIAHRGLWTVSEEKNTEEALLRALDQDFGIETDIRDYMGRLVISHNVADESSPLAEVLFRHCQARMVDSVLALNVKADGIQPLLIPLLEKYGISNYFLFDMSVPEMVVYHEKAMPYYTRQSDIEKECVLYETAAGVWMDSFYNDTWLTAAEIDKHLSNQKRVCLISPELHGKPYQNLWKMLQRNGFSKFRQIALCTDNPVLAKEYFHE